MAHHFEKKHFLCSVINFSEFSGHLCSIRLLRLREQKLPLLPTGYLIIQTNQSFNAPVVSRLNVHLKNTSCGEETAFYFDSKPGLHKNASIQMSILKTSNVSLSTFAFDAPNSVYNGSTSYNNSLEKSGNLTYTLIQWGLVVYSEFKAQYSDFYLHFLVI